MQNIFNYIDFAALGVTLFTAFALTFIISRKSTRRLWLVPAYFTFLAPSAILVFMTAHLAENTVSAIASLINGTFEYSFRFYSLFFLGVVMVVCGISYMKATIEYMLNRFSSKKVLLSASLILLITVPLIPITTIAFVPTIACGISLTALAFARRKRKFIHSDAGKLTMQLAN
jgi:hypothetical protein